MLTLAEIFSHAEAEMIWEVVLFHHGVELIVTRSELHLDGVHLCFLAFLLTFVYFGANFEKFVLGCTEARLYLFGSS